MLFCLFLGDFEANSTAPLCSFAFTIASLAERIRRPSVKLFLSLSTFAYIASTKESNCKCLAFFASLVNHTVLLSGVLNLIITPLEKRKGHASGSGCLLFANCLLLRGRG